MVDHHRRVRIMASCVPVPAPAAAANTEEVCANCGKGANDTFKLKNCTACFLVKYCSVDCQKIHRKQHKKACKERAAELKDDKLYGQGHERSEEDFCPICLLPSAAADARARRSSRVLHEECVPWLLPCCRESRVRHYLPILPVDCAQDGTGGS